MENKGFISSILVLFLLLTGLSAYLVMEIKGINEEISRLSQQQDGITKKMVEKNNKEEKKDMVNIPDTITINKMDGDSMNQVEVSPDREDWTIHKDGTVQVVIEDEYYVGMEGKFWPEGIEGPGFVEQVTNNDLIPGESDVNIKSACGDFPKIDEKEANLTYSVCASRTSDKCFYKETTSDNLSARWYDSNGEPVRTTEAVNSVCATTTYKYFDSKVGN